MKLAAALGAEKHRVIAIIGAGGKTSLMFLLAGELAASGKRVVTTTTTHIMTPNRGQSPHLLVHPQLKAQRAQLEHLLGRHQHLTVAAQVLNDTGKLRGVAPEAIDWLAGLDCVDVIIVEADGAARKTLKASGSHEPVVPSSTDLLVCVCGLDGVGGRIADTVFRPDLYCQVTGQLLDEQVTPHSLASMLCHDLSRISAGFSYKKTLVLNKADDSEMLQTGEQVVDGLQTVAPNLFAEIYITRLADRGDPVKKKYGADGQEVRYSVAGIILAGGRGTRMGKLKQLLPFASSTVLQNVIDAVQNSVLNRVVIVLGHEASQIRGRVNVHSAQVVENDNYLLGQSASLQAGISALPESCEYALFLLADQPLVKTETINLLVAEAQRTGALLIAPCFENRRGNPVLVHRFLFPAIHEITGDVGARPLLKRYREQLHLVVVEDPGVVQDIDTPEDYETLASHAGSGEK